MIHRLETNKLRNVAKLFAHLLASDALPWAVLAVIQITEEETTSSSRIFIKILFQELSEILGLRELDSRLQDPTCTEWFAGLFPKDSAKNMRFAINFFTSIGLGGLTDNMREFLKKLPQILAAQKKAEEASSSSYTSASSSEYTSASAYSSSSGYATESSYEEGQEVRHRKRSRSRSQSPSPPPRRHGPRDDDDRAPPRRRERRRR